MLKKYTFVERYKNSDRLLLLPVSTLVAAGADIAHIYRGIFSSYNILSNLCWRCTRYDDRCLPYAVEFVTRSHALLADFTFLSGGEKKADGACQINFQSVTVKEIPERLPFNW